MKQRVFRRNLIAVAVGVSLAAAGSTVPVHAYNGADAPDTASGAARAKSSAAGGPATQQAADASAPAAKTKAEAKQKVTDLGGISVTGQLAALRRAQATKEDAIGVVDSVSAEEAGKFPDQNVADALQRVPGVSVDRSGGESNHITVRGFGPTFVNVLLNGRTMATASSDRAFDFDVLPSEIIQQAVVNKTGMADLPAGGIGGTVNVITAQPSDFNGFHVAFSAAGVNDNIGGGLSSKTTPKVSGVIGDSNADHSFGWLLSFLYYKRDHVKQSVNAGGWIPDLDYSAINPAYTHIWLPQTVEGDLAQQTGTRRSVNGAIDWNPTDSLSFKFNTLISEYRLDTLTHGFGEFTNTGDIKSLTADDNGTALKYTRFNTGVLANDYIINSSPSDAFNEQTGMHVTYQLDSSTEIDFDSSLSKAWDKPSGSGYDYVLGTRNIGVNPVWMNNGSGHLPGYSNLISTTDMSDLRAHYFTTGSQNVSDRIFSNKLHLSKSFLSGVLSKLDFGVENSRRAKTKINWGMPDGFGCTEYCGYVAMVPADAVDADIFHAGSLVDGVSPGFPSDWISYDVNKLRAYLATPAAYDQLPNPQAFKAILDANGGGFDARPDPRTYSKITEHVKSAYAMASFEGDMWSLPWSLNAGIRYTKTDTVSSAYSAPVVAIYVNPNDTSNAVPSYGPLQPISEDGSYGNWLPSLNFKLNLTDRLIFRFAASKTLTRPDLSNLANSVSYNFRPTEQTISKGNAGLKPYTSKNYDAGLEWYINDESYIALDGFYKKVSNFSTLVTTTVDLLGFPFQLTEPVNLNTAKIKGAEFTFNYQFRQLPAPFDGLGVATNYTYVTSSASINPSLIATEGKFAVPGIGDSANASVYYDKGRWQLRLAYNWRDKYLSSIAGDQSQPTTVKSYGQLDFSSSVQVSKHLSVFLDETNLTNEKIYNYQVYTNRENYAEANGRTLFVGIRGSW